MTPTAQTKLHNDVLAILADMKKTKGEKIAAETVADYNARRKDKTEELKSKLEEMDAAFNAGETIGGCDSMKSYCAAYKNQGMLTYARVRQILTGTSGNEGKVKSLDLTVTVKVAIYCRVSTRDKGQETANQRLQLESFVRKQGWKVSAVYEDRVSGKRGESGREAFKQVFAAAARREWDCLLFWSLDRFSREGAFPTLRYLTRLSELGVSYRSYTEEYINSTGIFGDVIVSLLATLAKQETIRLSERTIAGLERARALGRVGGRPRVECDRSKVLKLHAAGKSLAAISKQLGISKTSVHRIVKQSAKETRC